MNDYAVIRNALVATFLVVIFMVSLQPEKISVVTMSVTNFIKDAIYSKDIDAAEKNNDSNNEMTFSIASQGFSLPKDRYTVESTQDTTTIFSGDNEVATINIDNFEGNLQDKVVSLANEYKSNSDYEKITIQPVMRGSTLYFDVKDGDTIVMAVKDIGEGKYANVIINAQADQTETENLLGNLHTL